MTPRSVLSKTTSPMRPSLEKQRKRGLPCAQTDVLDLDTNDVRGILNFNASTEVHRTSIIEREGRDQEIEALSVLGPPPPTASGWP